MGERITPELIVERHKKHPDGTADMIRFYANNMVYEHVRNLIRKSAITMVNNGTVIIASEYEFWHKFKDNDVFAGIKIENLKT